MTDSDNQPIELTEYVPATTKLKLLLLRDPRPQYMIAGEIGIHPTTLSLYSRGLSEITPMNMVRLTRYFDLEPEDIDGQANADELWAWYQSDQFTPEERKEIRRYT